MSIPQTLLCRYHYDPLDRLAGHAAAGETDIRLFYQKSRLATQIQGALHHSVLQVDDQLLAQQQHSAKAVATTLLGTDSQRSVLQSMGHGQVEASAYTAYGHLPASSGLSSLLGFDGERRDPVTGHYLLGNGYRAFNPVLMRFNSPDSLSPFGEGGLNAYAYCQGDPVNYRDPTGHVKGFPLPKGLKNARLASNSSRVATQTSVIRPVADVSARASVIQYAGRSVSPAATQIPSNLPSGAVSLDAFVPKREIPVSLGVDLKFYKGSNLMQIDDVQYRSHMRNNANAFRSYMTVHESKGVASPEHKDLVLTYSRYISQRLEGRYGKLLTSSALSHARKRNRERLNYFSGNVTAVRYGK